MNYLVNDNIKIKPEGFIKKFLLKQKNGLTGHIENALEPYISYSWNKYPENEINQMDPLWKWVPFEQTAYYLDGAISLARLLSDKNLYEKTSKIIYDVINNADDDGYLGPLFLKDEKKTNRWPFVVFARACMSLYYTNHDYKIIEALQRHYLSSKATYFKGRNIVNIETMLLVYSVSKNKQLLDLAILSYDLFQRDLNKDIDYCSHYTLASELSDNIKPFEHGVTYNEIAKLGAILYIYTNDKKYLNPTINAYKKIIKYHMLPDGLHSSNEYFHGKKASQTHETCNVSDYTWSLLYLLKACKDGKYADLIENCIYNAGIGSVLENFKALQYFSGVNQIILEKNSNHNFYRKGRDWMCYKPGHETQCCAGNVNRFFVNFVSNMYLTDNDGIYAIFYGSNTSYFTLNNQKITIKQESNYPFDDYINFSFKSKNITNFNLYLRIPSWSKHYKVYKNDIEIKTRKIKGFVKINVNSNDIIKLYIPSDIEIKTYNKTGVIVKKGAILYALGMKGHRKKLPYSAYPMYEITPDKDFNYGININEANPSFKIINNSNDPFNLDSVNAIISIDAYKINDMKIIHKNKIFSTNDAFNKNRFVLKGNFSFTPNVQTYKQNDLIKERITLYPFGACKLRIAIFPKVIK
ncbi:MAG: glycoside hydrolase family 127 protein [Erysipelotrichaceae bacterium]|nr:glycoside hydrolase family 127 protein [Erysipelotrichaceae bacterium]